MLENLVGRYILGAKRKKQKTVNQDYSTSKPVFQKWKTKNFPAKQKLQKFIITRTDKKKLQGVVKAETKE